MGTNPTTRLGPKELALGFKVTPFDADQSLVSANAGARTRAFAVIHQARGGLQQRGRFENTRSAHRAALYNKYADRLEYNFDLSRSLVSFQANKAAPFYGWFKYREAFSSELVRYLLERFRPPSQSCPRLLDPFSGAGTALTTAAEMGWEATGIEVLPVGAAATRARLLAATVSQAAFCSHLKRLEDFDWKLHPPSRYFFPHLRITQSAFPPATEEALACFNVFLESIRNRSVRDLFRFACLSILEEVSYTRKDGQYLRWDSRSGRPLRSQFCKGPVREFRRALLEKLRAMLADINARGQAETFRRVRVVEGSCLEELPRLADSSFDLVVTSPPYCNRYDYTRTYAIELAFLGKGEGAVRALRQALLSCTVENKSKVSQLAADYLARGATARFEAGVSSFERCRALHEVLGLLKKARAEGNLNNNSIPNLVENYFFEMNLTIRELARVLARGGRVVMVNDNVQYSGEEVPVDLILSEFAEAAGLTVERIWVLPKGKGNSSQQMGAYGRSEVRKCVYVWSS
jgi:hypothetical protein